MEWMRCLPLSRFEKKKYELFHQQENRITEARYERGYAKSRKFSELEFSISIES